MPGVCACFILLEEEEEESGGDDSLAPAGKSAAQHIYSAQVQICECVKIK